MTGETALLNIVRGNNSKNDPEKVCVFCSKTFISRYNRLKHTEKCHKGTANHTIGKVRKEYVCILCGKNYCNQRTLINHTKVFEGDMCHTAPSISQIKSLRVAKLRSVQIQLSISLDPPTLVTQVHRRLNT